MGYFDLGADGPYFNLLEKDVEKLSQKGFLNFVNENLAARILLVEHDPNQKCLPNGAMSAHDLECNEGIRIRRFPEDICPSSFHGKLYYVLRMQKSLFRNLVEKAKNSTDRIGYLHPRCKYDRFALRIMVS